MKKSTVEKDLTVCALPETEDQINSSRAFLPTSSENLWFLIFLGG